MLHSVLYYIINCKVERNKNPTYFLCIFAKDLSILIDNLDMLYMKIKCRLWNILGTY